MIKTRQNVFETNSSSSHSITVSANAALVKPEGEGPITLNGGDFDWETENYYDFETKANYVAQSCRGDTQSLSLLQRVVSEFTGRVCNIGELNGGIDHQSEGTVSGLFPTNYDNGWDVEEASDRLRQFLFSPHSELHTGNDNG